MYRILGGVLSISAMGTEDCLKVQMLGGFAMEYQGKKIQIGRNRTTKGLQLLQLLLHNYPNSVAKKDVFDALFGHDAEGDLGNNLRVIMHNLRKMLAESELPAGNYIFIEDGRCYFSCPFPVEIDAHRFEELVNGAGRIRNSSEEKCLEMLREASSLYGGFFLPSLAGEEWVIVADALYQHLYFRCMEELCRILKKRGRYGELLEHCNRAAALYPFDEWQVWQMECLMALGRPKDALELYETTTAMYFDELGLSPSERMLELFRQMSSQIQLGVSDINMIQGNLKESGYENGAFYCSYPCFVTLYRMVARMMERSGQSNYLLLCTVTDDKYRPLEMSDRLRDVSDKLRSSIHEALRRGDVFTRYNMNQFLVILMGIREEECSITTGRIDTCFRKRETSRKIKISYRLVSVANVDREEI